MNLVVGVLSLSEFKASAHTHTHILAEGISDYEQRKLTVKTQNRVFMALSLYVDMKYGNDPAMILKS